MYYSLVDPSKLSDNEIYDTIGKLQQRIAHAIQYGQHQMAKELELYVATLQSEQQDRIYKRSVEKEEQEMKRHPDLRPRYGNTPINLGDVTGEKTSDEKKK